MYAEHFMCHLRGLVIDTQIQNWLPLVLTYLKTAGFPVFPICSICVLKTKKKKADVQEKQDVG